MIIPFQDKYPDVKKALFIAENASVIGDVTLEENVGIWFGAVLRGDEGPIRVGKNSNVQDNSVVHMDVGDEVIIGEDVTIGHNCIIHGCTIGDGTLVGMGAIIMNHAVIGKNCIIGAGALVTEGKVFPDNSLIIGSPAVAKKEVIEEQKKASAENIATYVKLAGIFGGKENKS
ncbi:MAG: gamma carbonic anhydrase family protein [Lachnospiraceae bacterium]|nr:gamma carbonic anhydrase family protein [Lachnospiraceae bacterium]